MGAKATAASTQAPLELNARSGFGQLERLAQELACRPRSQRSIAAVCELMGDEASSPKTICQGRGCQRRQFAKAADAESFE